MSGGDIDVRAALTRGEVDFMGVRLTVKSGVLVARPETEVLGLEAARILRERGGHPRVVDVCCGSGNLACGIASHIREAQVWAVDLTEACVALARHNVSRHGLGVKVLQGDLFEPLASENLAGKVDIIVCNPPYISTGKLAKDKAELLESEPREAFDGGPYGISIHGRVVREAPALLTLGGYLLVEFGPRQEKQIQTLFQRTGAYHDPYLVNDAQGTPRVAVGQKS